jgi:CHAD domain-containing protein
MSHSHDHDHARPAPQAEHDKLGPLGAPGGALGGDALRAAVIAEFAAAAEAAKVAAGSVDAGAATAVHEYRKALRRGRAVLTMVGGALPKSERRAVKLSLQEARRAVSTVRDHAVAPETVAKLELGDDERLAADGVLSNASEAMPPVEEIRTLLVEGAKRAAQQVEALEAALPQKLELGTLVEGVRAVYAEAREARDGAKKSTHAFHAWRRRTKELVYQLELLARWAGKRVAALHDEADGAADSLSPAVDLIMLREFVATYAQGVGTGHLAKLADALDDRLASVMKDARKASRDAFDRKPGAFAKKLERAVKKDLMPAAESEPEHDAGDEHDGEHDSHDD